MNVFNYNPLSVYTNVEDKQKNWQKYLTKKLTVRLLGLDNKKDAKEYKGEVYAFDASHFSKYKDELKKADRYVSIIGKTKLKRINIKNTKSHSDNSILNIEFPTVAHGAFEVCDNYKFSRPVAFIPVGNDRFIAVMRFNWLILFIIIALLLTGLMVTIFFMLSRPEEVLINRYIEENDTEIVNTNHSATRYRMNTTMTVIKGTIQNLNFENVNENKYLRIKILKDASSSEYIYDSGFVPYGKKIVADVLSENIATGTYNTLAEVLVYDENKEQVVQTNFEVKLIVKEAGN